MSQQGFQLRLPWWFFVGLIGFFVFGGWKGFFGAIFGVLFLPIALFLGLAAVVIIWMLISGKKVQRFPINGQNHFEHQANQTTRHPHTQGGDIIEAEAKVVHRDD